MHCRGVVYYSTMFSLIWFLTCLGILKSEAQNENPKFSQIPLYRVVCQVSSADLENTKAKCLARSIEVEEIAPDKLATQWGLDYRSALRLQELLKRLGADANLEVKGADYKELLESSQFPKEKFASFSDLKEKPNIAINDATSQSLYAAFQEISSKNGITRKDRIACLENQVDSLRFNGNDTYSQYLAAMYHYMSAQELQDQYDQTLTAYQALPLSADMNRHFLTAYIHMDDCANLPGPLQEEAVYERAMIAYFARSQGDILFRVQQAITEIDRYLQQYPEGKHAFRLKLHRLDITKDILGIPHLLEGLKDYYLPELANQSAILAINPAVTSDPGNYESVLAIITYSETMFLLKNYSTVVDFYQAKFGQLQQTDFPASTYWMFSILWHVEMLVCENQGAWDKALAFAEMKLATPPPEGNAWPQGNPKAEKLQVLRSAARYARHLQNEEKSASYELQADNLEKEEGQ